MSLQHIDAYVVTGTDPHQSEYIPDYWNIRKWLSGFTGSAGQMVITSDFAGLWTDSRYFIQAEKELENTGVQLMRQKVQFAPEYLTWIEENITDGSKVLVNGLLISKQQFDLASKSHLSHSNIITEDKILDKIWHDRLEKSQNRAFILHDEYTGIKTSSKLSRIHQWLQTNELDGILFSALDDVAWVTNLRGYDVPYNPVLVSFLYVSVKVNVLFIEKEKLDPTVLDYLVNSNIDIISYEEVYDYLKDLPADVKIGMDKTQCNYGITEAAGTRFKSIQNPVVDWKAEKNFVEIENVKKAMVSDGLALTKAFYWLEKELLSREVSEYEFGKKLTFFRSEDTEYLMDSFGSIVGYMGNGAIIHYSAGEEDCALIKNEGILLVDSGGQYKTGTTDITRTIALGTSEAEPEIKKAYTLVLKGMIALSDTIFPIGTTGVQMDIMARQFLWQNGWNYAHGTGHGVGYCLNVHEGPQGFAGLNSVRGKVPFSEGMITSNEPGYYQKDKYGIRIENLILTQKHNTFESFLRFETLTLFPIDTKLIDTSLLSRHELDWINQYHQTVYVLLCSGLDENLKKWLSVKCKTLE